MTLEQIKNRCHDCRKTHRWADVRSDFDITKSDVYRIVGVGRKHIRVMSGRGIIFNVKPEDVKRAW